MGFVIDTVIKAMGLLCKVIKYIVLCTMGLDRQSLTRERKDQLQILTN